jgi:nitrite reductase/ring-hydroxylating ferredoxin subunit
MLPINHATRPTLYPKGGPDPRRDTQHERGLVCVAVYERTVHASLERVWENVLDWEHLPWLHGGSFSSIECLEAGRWGWRARVGLQPASASRAILLELVIEPDEPRYVSRTLEGAGAGTEIWTRVDLLSAHETDIRVEFFLAAPAPEQVAALGAVFTSLYSRLWDEDEEMMIARESELQRRVARSTAARGATAAPRSGEASGNVSLGSLGALEASLPLVLEYAGRRFRIVLHDGSLVAHSVVCPHTLGPLADVPVEAGRVVCPWHGYAYDVVTGRECSGRPLRLAPAPRVRVDAEQNVWLEEPTSPR